MYNSSIKMPIKDVDQEAINDILNGTDVKLDIQNETMSTSRYVSGYDGLIKYIEIQQSEDAGSEANKWSGQFFSRVECPECNGQRLNKESLHYFIDGKNIADLAQMDIAELATFIENLKTKLTGKEKVIASEILKEIGNRLSFLMDVGLNYLSLNRNSSSLSGGESQRIRLATQIGSQLVNVLYILDEPEAALSPMRLMRLMYCIKELVNKNSQFIISTHSPILMTYPGAEVLEISEDGIKSVDYKDTEHFIITKRFMDAPERITEDLLS